ncbi:uncharacterized protein LOC121191166 [Toxotes jaculatrix]|uniref:uncharacterized protein LOC121191166 n=1 Tax=Toxotes jaculatrix TaxID=941984 RepID=UPI001B3AACC0|nr:uncharacterized protein LOC121191166 [Toxotes jaculatrix]
MVKAKMIFICMIITALAATAQAKGAMECNLSESTGAQHCSGALGKPLIFYLPISTNKRITLTRNADVIIRVGNNTETQISNKYHDRTAFITNETFKLDKVTKSDSGYYLLETYGPDGALSQKINIHLEIQAPVSKPAVSQMCLSPEVMKVSCSSEGDGAEFILTLDSNLLIPTRAQRTDEQHQPSVSNVTISLHGQLIGNLMCTVQNNVSREETDIHLTSCKGSTSHLSLVTVAVITSAATLLLLLLLLLLLFLGIKHFIKKARPMTVNKDNAEDEIVYSEVKTKKLTRETRPKPHQNAT